MFLVKSEIDCGAEGAFCNVYAAIQCCEDQQLECHLPPHPGYNGICVKTCPKLGETCGGFLGIQCCGGEGLKCELEAQCCDMPGKCVKA